LSIPAFDDKKLRHKSLIDQLDSEIYNEAQIPPFSELSKMNKKSLDNDLQ
jgi:hypothetical protein